jgi:hypothetical protein
VITMAKLFGFDITRSTKEKETAPKSFVPAMDSSDEGAITVQSSGFFGQYINLENTAKSDVELINRYREMAMHPEVDIAVDDIVSEAIVSDTSNYPIKIDTQHIQQSDAVKKKIAEEFINTLKLIKIKERGYDLFRNWFVDGRIYLHIIIDEKRPKNGIQELRLIDPRKIKKIKEVEKQKDPATGADLVKEVQEYYLYSEKGIMGGSTTDGIPITTDAISYVTSGLTEGNKNYTIGHLHKAIKPLNQLKMIEDSVVIYRWTRAPERRVFYIDVGNLPKQKAEQYMNDIMVKHKNKIVYDGSTGEVRDDRKHLSMLEDYWFPRREGGRGTEIETLPGGTNLGEMDDVLYFQKKLYKSLNVPMSRLQPENQIQLGRAQDISRDEYKFNRFITRLRSKFGNILIDILKKQLILKGVISPDEWEDIHEDIFLDYSEDSYYTEIKNSEIIRDRVALAGEMEELIGTYYSKEWVRRNVLHQTEDEIKELQKQMDAEKDSEPEGDEDDDGGF